MSEDILGKLTSSIIEGDLDLTVALTREALQAKLDPMTIINQGLVPGMDIVGEKFASGEYFLPNIVIAGSAMQQAMELLEPELKGNSQSLASSGMIVIGTVHGDIHEIGKSLVGTMLTANGFEVHDLGVDVATETFIAKLKETGAPLLGLSALLTTTMIVQREIIEALLEAGIRDQVKVLVGGAPVHQEWADSIGADGYAEDAMAAVTLAKRLIDA
ncbi:MAG: corrinoid protein [Anaerolineales bacterium]|jgi:5-methyltetrahydrofolate--homocysteine methyltransferase